MDRYSEIKQLMQQNIIVAVGCTEPVAVAFCVAKAKEVLAEEVKEVELDLSKNIIKNAMGVGIPGTGMIGLPIAVALGVVCGESSKGLEVLCSAKEHLTQAKVWLNAHPISVNTKDTEEKLYIECICKGANSSSRVIIAGTHTNIIHISKNNQLISSAECEQCCENSAQNNLLDTLSAKEVYDYAMLEDTDKLEWIKQTAKLNSACSEEGLKGNYGLSIGKLLFNDWDKNIRNEIIARTCAASDARMDGVTLPIYSNSGSGNQGITCTLPIYYYALKINADDDALIRALTLSHLMSIYIKSKIGRLSALCGLTNAAMGVAAGITYLSSGTFSQICFAIRNMINTVTGMVCDGAKPSCALKMATVLNSAFDSVKLALNNIVVDNTDGIAEDDIDSSIESLGKIGRYAMCETDDMILSIMTHKKH
ncbi:MAG: serine dehydratase subunit alpha family protein [Bacteroidales bacterium]|nr:serine dehydratase subunit alpha family protein [Bacteroidales bacterium]